MRTTVTLAEDVAREVERLRASQGLGPSEAINQLARRGMARRNAARIDYVHRADDIGIRIDVANIGDVLELLDNTP
ncbi:MAG: CopG family transcriptional regulator [Nostocoides sp.]|uniref:CopG family transcriptional regulator n=1 Tax=Nostocoides sp. TaxID=1917966 RepID=UPI003BC44E91